MRAKAGQVLTYALGSVSAQGPGMNRLRPPFLLPQEQAAMPGRQGLGVDLRPHSDAVWWIDETAAEAATGTPAFILEQHKQAPSGS